MPISLYSIIVSFTAKGLGGIVKYLTSNECNVENVFFQKIPKGT